MLDGQDRQLAFTEGILQPFDIAVARLFRQSKWVDESDTVALRVVGGGQH